jgi:hypothetical protein
VVENQLLKALARETTGERIFEACCGQGVVELLVKDLFAKKVTSFANVQSKLATLLIELAQLHPPSLYQEHLGAGITLHKNSLSLLELPPLGSSNKSFQFGRLQVLKHPQMADAGGRK